MSKTNDIEVKNINNQIKNITIEFPKMSSRK